jgi:polysaccharide export outer membrane protein
MKHLMTAAWLSGCLAANNVVFAQEPSPRPPAVQPAPADEFTPTAASAAPAAPGTDVATPPPVPTPAATARDLKPAAGGDPTAINLASVFQIGPEDVLDISVWKNPELSRVVPVRPDGKVSLPLVNDIQAAGLTPTDLRDQLTTRLSEYVPAPEVSVIVREVHSRKVTVTGAVKTPGRYELKSPMTVLEVLALAQGLTDFASRDRIVVLRQEGQKTTRIPFNYRKISDSAAQDNFLLRPGDIVLVP